LRRATTNTTNNTTAAKHAGGTATAIATTFEVSTPDGDAGVVSPEKSPKPSTVTTRTLTAPTMLWIAKLVLVPL
jgi:hypothetical protein